MDKKQIKENFRKVLLEKKGDKHDYGCVMLKLKINKNVWDDFQSMIDEDDVYTEEGDQSFGREDEPHITILYGLHDTIYDDEIKKITNNIESVDIELKKISIFEHEKFDVVKFDITGDSKSKLEKMNKLYTKLPYTTSYPDYKPHATICYVKRGKGKKYIKTLSDDDLLKLKSTEITYSKSDGSNLNFKLK